MPAPMKCTAFRWGATWRKFSRGSCMLVTNMLAVLIARAKALQVPVDGQTHLAGQVGPARQGRLAQRFRHVKYRVGAAPRIEMDVERQRTHD